jgi:thioredoxin 1
MAGDNTLTFTDAAFDVDVLNSSEPVLVDFWAPWCGPCRAMAPTVDALAAEYAGKIKVGKMNTDDNPSTPMRYGIRGIPTLLLFKGGQVVEQRVGAVAKGEVVKMLAPHVGDPVTGVAQSSGHTSDAPIPKPPQEPAAFEEPAPPLARRP